MSPASSFPSFRTFFQGVHGFAPYAWQEAASEIAAEKGRLPRIVDVPTGLGKTALVDVWVWALARAVHRDLTHSFGQRYVHAVERRSIVDGADHHMVRLAEALQQATEDTAVGAVAAALEKLSGTPGERLFVTTFHGTKPDDRGWLDHPRGAVVLTTTVTQLVLRVLGQAPGVSAKSAVIHAGLLGHDSVWVIDEPHLSAVMVDTLRQCTEMAETTLTCLGATIPEVLLETLDHEGEATVRFAPDAEGPEAHQRYRAPRPAEIRKLGRKAPAEVVAQAVAATATDTSRTVVFANTVAVAAEVVDRLERDASVHAPVRLVTSRVRPVDRSGDPAPVPGEIVVATQTLEAGVDFEVDLLVTQAAAWPALIQRIGRLNRYGTAQDPKAVLVVPDSKPDGGSVAVYGEEIMEIVCEGLRGHESLDFSLEHAETARSLVIGDASPWPEPVRTGILDPEYAALMLLAPAPEATTLWLRGLDQKAEAAPVSVVWRECLEPEVLDAASPQRGEQIDVSVSLARGLVAGQWVGDLADVDDADQGYRGPTSDRPSAERDRLDRVRVWKSDTWETPVDLWSITPGSTVVLHTSLGGYLPERGVWQSTSPVEDRHADAGTARVVALDEELQELPPRQLAARLDGQVVVRADRWAVVLPRAARTARRTTGDPLSLADHLRQTGGIAEHLVGGAATVDGGYRADVVRAAAAHDIGKAHPSFQRYLGAEESDPLLGKSTGRTSLPWAAAQPVDHAQHGAWVVSQQLPGDEALAHLVGAHHGARGSEQYLMLCGENPWRLAWQETLVRLADWRASAEPDPTAAGPVVLDEEAYVVAGRSPEPADEPYVDLLGFQGTRVGAWYATLGTAWAAQEVLGRTVKLSWPKGLDVPRLHGVLDSELGEVTQWVNDELKPRLEAVAGAADGKDGNLFFSRSQRAVVPDLVGLAERVLEASEDSQLVRRMARHLVSPNTRHVEGKDAVRSELAGGWLANNGSVLGRFNAAPAADPAILTSETEGWELSPELTSPDHGLDRLSDAVPHRVRTGEYRLIAIGVAVSGRPLSQAGVANAQRRRRFLPRPTEPTTLWGIDVLGRLRRGPALVAEETTMGHMVVVKPATVVAAAPTGATASRF